MKKDFPALWAESPATLRREPTNGEMANGFPCGDLDINLFNELVFRLAQAYRELSYVITASGQKPNPNDGTQIWKAILSAVPVTPEFPPIALWHSGAATGPTNALSVTLAPVISTYQDRLPVFVTFPSGPVTGATIALNGLPAIPIQRNDGSQIQAADLPSGASALFHVASTGTNAWALRLASFGRAEVQRIAINPTLWVRTDGNDANDGLANTAGGAFRTIEAALARGTSQYNFASSALNIRLGQTGRYASPGAVPRGTGTINIIGNAANQSAYIISGAGSPGQGSLQTATALTTNGVTIENTGTQSHTLAATNSAPVILFNTTLLSTVGTSGSHAFAPGGDITFAGGNILQGNAFAALNADGGDIGVNPNTTLTIAGNPTFSGSTVRVRKHGRVTLLGGASVSGGASGQRYFGGTYGIIDTNGAGENAFPGSSPGAVSDAKYL